MKKFLILFLLLCLGCQVERLEIPKDPSTCLKVSLANDTKAHIEDYSNVWDEGDTLYLVALKLFRYKLLLTEKISDKEAYFKLNSVSLTDGIYDAYLGLEPVGGNKWAIKDTYRFEDKRIFAFGNTILSNNESNELQLKNICGIIHLIIDELDYSITKMKIEANVPISGNVIIDKDLNAVIYSDSKYTREYISNTGWNVYPWDKREYYISLPPGDYNMLNFTFTFFDGSTCEKTLKKPITIERSKIYDFQMRLIPEIKIGKFSWLPYNCLISNIYYGWSEQYYFSLGDYFAWDRSFTYYQNYKYSIYTGYTFRIPVYFEGGVMPMDWKMFAPEEPYSYYYNCYTYEQKDQWEDNPVKNYYGEKWTIPTSEQLFDLFNQCYSGGLNPYSQWFYPYTGTITVSWPQYPTCTERGVWKLLNEDNRFTGMLLCDGTNSLVFWRSGCIHLRSVYFEKNVLWSATAARSKNFALSVQFNESGFAFNADFDKEYGAQIRPVKVQ